ncbi:fatty acid desaturase family protein [Fulvivirga sediminis]|uniref:Acyl-CoA desaturase n=1 Tax=Fulvivirga sediminis TaxID=2803949 RepID=A0A937F9E2_9BACT|nr:acyl-CoA desaturase [Fulvivirga sediminis]MBL3656428.1 acyl-CoA desaturase [Fulvivirga sediminis]
MKIKFNGRKSPAFYAEVRKEVNAYFKENNIGKHANGEMIFKSIFFLGSLVLVYLMIVFGGYGAWVNLSLAILLGMIQAFIGFNVSHDAIHGAYSSKRSVNQALSMSFNLIGANAYVWKITHNQVHHTYTNIPGHDEDLDVAPGLVRLSPLEEMKPLMKYQHLYAFFLYGLASLSWVFRKDYVKFFKKEIGSTDNTNHPRKEYFNLFFYKILYYCLFIVVPLLVMDITWWQFIIGFFMMHWAEGLVLGLVFQLAHVVEGTDFPEPGEEGQVDESWAIHQMMTTADFSRDSWLAKFFCGGLNFQVEHHLFPNICHVHYPEISKIVEKVAKRHNVPFHENKTFIGALNSHYRMLKKFGKEEAYAPVPVSV